MVTSKQRTEQFCSCPQKGKQLEQFARTKHTRVIIGGAEQSLALRRVRVLGALHAVVHDLSLVLCLCLVFADSAYTIRTQEAKPARVGSRYLLVCL